eukprot:scaffold3827_cov394-Prasinococcus_capsulatus_cf.AAC.1
MPQGRAARSTHRQLRRLRSLPPGTLRTQRAAAGRRMPVGEAAGTRRHAHAHAPRATPPRLGR